VPFNVKLERVAFGFQRTGMISQAFVLVAPEFVFIRRCKHAGCEGFEKFGRPLQVCRVVRIGHQVGKPAQETLPFRGNQASRRHRWIRHEACPLGKPSLAATRENAAQPDKARLRPSGWLGSLA